ncbi:MAG: hypothetical protein HS115_08710 [Spirochaetales bacterium]|nr:hypothetical protein [Spirochaetales bacterium]
MRFLLVFLLFLSPLFSFDRTLLFRNLEHHYIETMGDSSKVDWTGGYVFASARLDLERIDPLDRQAPGSITEARIAARERAREMASLALMKAIGSLPYDSSRTIQSMRKKDLDLARRLDGIKDHFLIKSSRTGEGYVSLELALPFVGPDGLLRALRPRFREPVPEAQVETLTDDISGIIVDTTLTENFRPALLPVLYNEAGLKIYSAEQAGNCLIRRGVAAYYSSLEQARRDLRAGRKPYTFYAIATNGSSDAVVSARDATFLTSASGRRNLRACRVIFVVKRPPSF